MNFVVRELEERDLSNGFIETLSYLRKVGNISEASIKEIFRKLKMNPDTKIFVAVNKDGKIIGATTLLIEQKFIHEGGLVGHIEDVVTHKDFRKIGVGSSLIEASLDFARNAGCYKVILDCSEENVPFYKKLGFERRSIQMRIDLHPNITAVILAAGLGTRLRPIIGNDVPKVMKEMKGRPLLQYTIDTIKKKGIGNVVMVVNHKKEQIMDYFGDGKEFGLNIEYVHQNNPKGGTADAVIYAKSKVRSDKFLLVYGDNVFDTKIIDMILKKYSDCDGVLAVKEMEDVSKYGIVEVDGDRVVGIKEKPDRTSSKLALAGLFVLPTSIFEAIDKINISSRGEYELTDAIQKLIDEGGKFGFVKIEGFWIDPRDKRELDIAEQFVE